MSETIQDTAARQSGALVDTCVRLQVLLDAGRASAVPDTDLQQLLTLAVRLYAAKAEDSGAEISPFGGAMVTPTDVAVTVCAMVRDADLNLLDLAMWFNRSPRLQ